MKQKTESKLTTLARLVAVYNDIARDKVRVRVRVMYGDKVSLRSEVLDIKYVGLEYMGSVSGAISAVAVALCRVSELPYVHLNIMF